MVDPGDLYSQGVTRLSHRLFFVLKAQELVFKPRAYSSPSPHFWHRVTPFSSRKLLPGQWKAGHGPLKLQGTMDFAVQQPELFILSWSSSWTFGCLSLLFQAPGLTAVSMGRPFGGSLLASQTSARSRSTRTRKRSRNRVG